MTFKDTITRWLIMGILAMVSAVRTITLEGGATIHLRELARFTGSGAEFLAYDALTGKLIVSGGGGGELQIYSLTNPEAPNLVKKFPLYSTNVAAYNGLAAVASPGGGEPGQIVFIDLATDEIVNEVPVGYLPDMVIFTPDGKQVLAANEGEFNVDLDPEGSISVIDLSSGPAGATVREAGFTSFNRQRSALVASGVRILPSAPSVAQALEPEFIAVSADSETAWVTLQENNALAVVDLRRARVTEILPLGLKDWSQSGLDSSRKDGPGGGPAINIRPWPVFGMYMPDSIVAFESQGNTFLLTANEGETRGEEVPVSGLQLDPGIFPTASNLQMDGNLGLLNVSAQEGDLDGDGDIDRLLAYGGRSFSIWSADGTLVYDSGAEFEEITAAQTPSLFNAESGDPELWDARSHDKGPEPEGAAVGVVGDKMYGFIGLEQAGGGVLVYDISQPSSPQFVQYVRSDQDIAPEGLVFVPAAQSPDSTPLLLVSNEASQTVTVYAVEGNEPPAGGGDTFRMFVPFLENNPGTTVPVEPSSPSSGGGETFRMFVPFLENNPGTTVP